MATHNVRAGDVGEYFIVKKLLGVYRDSYPKSPLGLGDDAAATAFNGRWLLLKIDGTSGSRSRYPWLSWADLGYRVALSAAVDLIAKGATVLGLAVSLGAPKDFPVRGAVEIVKGVTDLARALNSYVFGGDTNSSTTDVWVDVAAVGVADRVVPATGFKAGDVVRVTSCLGMSAIPAITYYMGLKVDEGLEAILRGEGVRRPKPPLNFYGISHRATASTDISDGLTSLTRFLRELGLDLLIDGSSIPLCPEVREFMDTYRVDVKTVLRFLGEEYVVVFTCSEDVERFPKLGRLVEGGGRVFIDGKEVRGGWDNFLGYLHRRA